MGQDLRTACGVLGLWMILRGLHPRKIIQLRKSYGIHIYNSFSKP
jgi:hypothetical protein